MHEEPSSTRLTVSTAPISNRLVTRNGPMLHAPDGKIGGNGRVSAPHASCATPRRRISSAMLAMKTVNGDSPISGRNSARSRVSAIPTQQMSAIGTPMPHGSFTPSVKVHMNRAPSSKISPCARLTMREER
jgi:hypothetical protein